MKIHNVDQHLDALKTLTPDQMAASFLFAVAVAQTMLIKYEESSKAEQERFDVMDCVSKILHHGKK
jgi:hypothetical protein